MGTKQYSNYADLITFSRASGGTSLRPISYGPELVTNGTFDTDTTGWTASANASLSVVSNALRVEAIANGGAVAYQAISGLTINKQYSFSFDVVSETQSTGNPSYGSVGSNIAILSVGRVSAYFTADATTVTIRFSLGDAALAGEYLEIDNASVKEVIFDQAGDPLTLFNHPNNVPRIDYDADGNRKGLLIEEARTNLATYSEDFSNAAWTQVNATVASVAVTAPDGSVFADKLVEDTAASTSHQLHRVIASSAQAYTWSCYAKAGERNWLVLNIFDGTSSRAYFNLSAGTIGTVAPSVTASISAAGNGWYRCCITRTPIAIASCQWQIGLATADNTFSYTGDGTSGIYIYGAQLEAGAFPTSYIPTSGSTVTRAADIASIPTSAFGYNQKAGSLVFDFAILGTASNKYPRVVALGNAAGNLSFYCTSVNLYYDKSGTGALLNRGIVVGAFEKFAASAGLTGGAFAEQTPSGVTSTTSTVDLNVPTVFIGSGGGTNNFLNGHIKSIQYYPRRLSNAQLQELTS